MMQVGAIVFGAGLNASALAWEWKAKEKENERRVVVLNEGYLSLEIHPKEG